MERRVPPSRRGAEIPVVAELSHAVFGGEETIFVSLRELVPGGEAVTFWVGPLNGLTCLGIEDEELSARAEVERMAAAGEIDRRLLPGS